MAISACLRPIGLTQGQSQEEVRFYFLKPLHFERGASWVLLGGRVAAPTLLLSSSSKDVTEGNKGLLTPPTLDVHRLPFPGPGQLSRCITVLGAGMGHSPVLPVRLSRHRTGQVRTPAATTTCSGHSCGISLPCLCRTIVGTRAYTL